jgi:hypothetical protein
VADELLGGQTRMRFGCDTLHYRIAQESARCSLWCWHCSPQTIWTQQYTVPHAAARLCSQPLAAPSPPGTP